MTNTPIGPSISSSSILSDTRHTTHDSRHTTQSKSNTTNNQRMDEILVHVSGPSTASDDARYRAQVAAIRDYLLTTNDWQRLPSERQVSAFEPAPSQNAEGPAEVQDQSEESFSQQSSSLVKYTLNLSGPASPLHAFETSNYEADNDENPVHDPQQDPMILALPSPETNSIGSASLAPNDRPRQGCGTVTTHLTGHDSLESLVSVIPDSQPELVSLSVQEGSDSALLFLQGVRGPSPPRHHHEDDSPDSPHSPSFKRRRMGNDGDLCGPSTSAGSFPPVHETTSSSLLSADQDRNNDQKAISIPTHTTTTSQTLIKNTPLQICPPPPPISTTIFTTHKTPTLSMLEARLNPSRTYKPTRQTRDLDKLERGYWAVQIVIGQSNDEDEGPARSGTWSPVFFSRFWGFLGEFIGREGRAGWGVWCFLDRVFPDTSSTSTNDAAAGGGTSGQVKAPSHPDPGLDTGPGEVVSVQLKVYTWGEIAMHIYLLLFLASERKIKGLGAQWRDSREEVVIQMP